MSRVAGLVVFGLLAVVTCGGTACGTSEGDSEFGSSGSSGASSSSGSSGFGSTSSGGTSNGGPPEEKVDECRKMDIVFVVDNSGSMEQEQSNLATNFPKFVKVISDYKTKSGQPLEFRIGVITTDDQDANLDKGKFRVKRGDGAEKNCNPGPPDRKWLERGDGDVASIFACRARAGTNGADTEYPLESMKNAVTTRISDGSNTIGGQSFVREDALLAFVVITDEDEGSAGSGKPRKPAPAYVADFDTLKGDRAKWASAIIAGPKACSSPGLGNAYEATRLKEFVASAGANAIFSSICEGDLTKGLQDALNVFDTACKNFPGGVN